MKRGMVVSLVVFIAVVFAAAAFAQGPAWAPMKAGSPYPATTLWFGVDLDGKQLAACKALADKAGKKVDVIGKTGPGLGNCRFEFDDKMGQANDFQVAVYGFWTPFAGSFPATTIWVGTDLDGKKLAICKAVADKAGKKADVIGKTGPGLGNCRFEFDTKMGQATTFSVLTSSEK